MKRNVFFLLCFCLVGGVGAEDLLNLIRDKEIASGESFTLNAQGGETYLIRLRKESELPVLFEFVDSYDRYRPMYFDHCGTGYEHVPCPPVPSWDQCLVKLFWKRKNPVRQRILFPRGITAEGIGVEVKVFGFPYPLGKITKKNREEITIRFRVPEHERIVPIEFAVPPHSPNMMTLGFTGYENPEDCPQEGEGHLPVYLNREEDVGAILFFTLTIDSLNTPEINAAF